ncbi:MAG: hypothetical protein QHC78_10180 [Pigmentiphaga sp.]|uniref:hypothetical protein n=1 Tax=Pigmentiphaga sp. TaxID=1977564 RepID=UPI0029A1C79E|nr:hypothetical protein [Pigmentiphaga sp.]MDX3906042.1 hypothetical protein [Pigmentiphaga sp.]
MRKRILMTLAVLAMVVLVGVSFGLWLSWNAPVDRAAEAPDPVAQGRPGEAPVASVDQQVYLPEPPQPRVDGTLGVPSRPVRPNDPIPMVSAADQPQPDTLVSTIAPDLQGLSAPPPTPEAPRVVQPSSQVVTVLAGGNGPGEPPRTSEPAPAAPGQESWINALRSELARCASQGVVGRGICTEQARWKYCNPGNHWGRVPECPATGNN